MKQVILALAIAGSMAGSYWVGSTYSDKRDAVQENLCLTDTAIVRVLEHSLGSWTTGDIQRYGAGAYERARKQTKESIQSFRDVAPCNITSKLPPDILKGG